MWTLRNPTVAVLAPGPSLSLSQTQQVRQAGVAAVAVNDAFRLAPWADVLYAADAAWWQHHAQEALSFEGLMMTSDPNLAFRKVKRLRQTGTYGFDPTPGCVRTGSNSGYQAVHVAMQAGAKRVLLVGFDMHGTHFFGRHPAPLRNSVPETQKQFAVNFQFLNGHGVDIINCTPGSAITCFPQQDLAEALHAA
jgi:hypothetical protein